MRPMAIYVADLFYDRLFELDPSFEDLFPEDLAEQRPRFTSAIAAIVNGVDDLGGMLPFLQDLGKRFALEGVREGHYVTMGKALLWTFEQTLAEHFTPAVKDAWAALYAFVTSAMLPGADSREAIKPLGRTLLAV